MQKILVAINYFNDEHMRRIAAAAEGWGVVERIDHESGLDTFTAKFAECDAVVGWPPAEALTKATPKFVQLCSAGYDPYLGIGLEKKDFIICNARGVFSVPCAEQVLAMMFALARRLNQHVRDQTQRSWCRADEYRIVTGDTICIVGMGSIGRAIAERCTGLGMKVIGVTRTGNEGPEPTVTRFVSFNQLPDVLPESDHVTLSAPANSQTAGLFNETMLRKMKPGSCFYNVGRGSLVVEKELVKVLKDGHLWGAGLDVFETEPLPEDSPLWGMNNVVIAPHSAGRDRYEYDRLCDLFTDNLKRFHSNEPLINTLDLSRGI